jgi:hypothetical protein
MRHLAILALVGLLIGCKSLLPVRTVDTQHAWSTYQDVDNVVAQIRVGQSLDDLRALGLDVHKTPNVESLTYLDIAKRFGLIGLKDHTLVVPDGVKKLMEAAENGRAYEMTVESTTHERIGSFWADFLQFRKKTHITGWKYTLLLIVVDDKVQYVLHKGNPNIDKLEKEKNPLGPFQKINGYILVDLATD